MRAASFSVPDDASGVAAARRFTRACLGDWGLDGTSDVAVLLVSEAVTNALLHTGRSPSLQLRAGPAGLRVEVRDASPALPAPRHPDATATTGRGLQLLDALASRWGTEAHGGGKVVWFEVEVTEMGEPTADAPGATRSGGGHATRRPGGRVSGRVDRQSPLSGRYGGSTWARTGA